MGVSQGQRVEVLAQQLSLRVACAGWVAGVEEPGGQVGSQPEPMVDLAKQQCPGVGSNSRIGLTNLDRAVKGTFIHGKISRPELASSSVIWRLGA